MRRTLGFAIGLVFATVLSADQPNPPSLGVSPAQPRAYPAPLLRAARTAAVPELLADLPQVSDGDVAAVEQWNAGGNVPPRAGVVRPFAEPVHVKRDGVSVMDAAARWRWRGQIHVADAGRMRLQLTDVHAPQDAIFWIYSGDAPPQAFDSSLAYEGTIWSPTVEGPAVTLEVEAPAGADLSFRIAGVAQMLEPKRVAPNGNECLQDAKCNTAVASFAKAIGLMNYIKNGQPYICSGGLMNERAATYKPYFLTANHCMSTAAEAASLEVTWDHTTPFCGAPFPSTIGLPRTSGATLLVTSAASDMTLLQLANAPGARWFMGWNPNPIAAGTLLRRVSHPNGWPQAYSESIVTTVSGSCTGWGRPNYVYSYNVVGSTAGGSSGSPVFYGDSYVVGQLSGSCGQDVQNPCSLFANRVDGSLATSWPLLKPYLDTVAPPPPPPPPPCAANATTVCLLGGRFRVTINYRNQFANPPQTGDFAAQRLNAAATNPDTGIFGFGNAQKVEVVVRIADARPFAARFDVYYGGLTDVEYWVNVTDTFTNKTKQYRNPPGTVGGGVDRATFPTQ